ncbi:hypothetical protein SAMN02745126_01179 [Enhydrobacter aerosaccus]|uniref:Uncharacterized protein n=1 Tax=Enhydrobacter aerosaccus TaxID=225324 RepID=A0A1T4KVF3_9HYPH|nr:hypothetical protein [Enhydrobacter aerosaccus]SJZ46415.1 hypothetical protein SAMN02745126_01179 [Enhydrobacter aerosaccus]
MKKRLMYLLELALVPVAALVVFLEQTLIRYLNVMMAAFARWTPVARVEAFLMGLPPWWAVLAFAAPSILILPVKLSALWFVAKGHFALAFGAVALGKVLATAILARLYRILRPNLMALAWFAWADRTFFAWRDWAYTFVRGLPAWQKAKALVHRLRSRAAELVSALVARYAAANERAGGSRWWNRKSSP